MLVEAFGELQVQKLNRRQLIVSIDIGKFERSVTRRYHRVTRELHGRHELARFFALSEVRIHLETLQTLQMARTNFDTFGCCCEISHARQLFKDPQRHC